MSEKDLPVLPRDERIETVEINGKPIQKHIYADGSYGICGDNYVDRYFPDGKIETYAREYVYYIDDYGGEYRGYKGLYRRTAEKLPDGTKRTWDRKQGHKCCEELPDGTERKFFHNGKIEYERLPNGIEREWSWDGQKISEKLPDGTERRWDDLGLMRYEQLPEGTECGWYDNGQMKFENLPDGTERRWHKNGQMESEKLPDGTERTWYGNGQMEYEKLPDGTEREWYDNDQMESEKLPDGTCFKYDEHGKITYHATNGVEDTVLYLAKERVEKRKEEKHAKLEGKPKVIQKIAGEITSTKAFNDIALKIATKKVKKDLGK